MRIAVPLAEDKESIFKRTGQAPYFGVYEGSVLEKIVDNSHGKHHHDHHSHSDDHQAHTHQHKKDIATLAGCDYIVVQAVGEHMQEALAMHNIQIKKVRQKDGVNAQEIIEKLIKEERI